jgi:hypothetical protein
MPKYFFYVSDLRKGRPYAGVADYGYPVDSKDIIWVTAPNSFAAETDALEAYQDKRVVKNGRGYKIISKTGKKSQ